MTSETNDWRNDPLENTPPLRRSSPPRALGAFGFAAMMRAGGYDPADAEMVAAKFELLGKEIERLTAAIQAHHDTKHGKMPRSAAVLTPPDKALYAAAGIEHRTMDADTMDAIRRAPAPIPDTASA